MLVSQKHETEIGLNGPKHSFGELLGKHFETPCIDVRAIFYSRANSETELLGWDDYVDQTGITAVRKP